jgi:tetratricopeptide (TPR) repeat protein
MSSNRDAHQDASTLAQIEAAAAANDIPRAIELARAALSDGLVHPMLLNLRSYWWTQRGRQDMALADLRRAVSIAPGDLFVRNALGILLGRMEKWPEAFAVLEETASLMPGSAMAQFSLGWAFEATGELDKARRQFEAAVALEPNFVKPLIHLSSLAHRRSDWRSSRELAERALALAPGDYVATTSLAVVAVAEGNLEQAETLLRSLLGRQAETPLDASMVRRTLGDLRHAQGRYTQAFAAYSESNRLKYTMYAHRFETPGTTAADFCRWLTSQFETGGNEQAVRADKANAPPEEDGAAGHVFLVGFPRSGTTLLENVLASHPDVSTLEERDTLGDLTQQFLINEAGLKRLAGLPAEEIRQYRSAYWDRVRKFGAATNGRIVVDKYPLTSMKLPLVAKLFPRAKILFAVRDPRDVVLSCFRRSFAMNTSMFEFLDIERAARFYDAVMTLCRVYRDKLGLDWLQVHNEFLIDDFESRAQEICAFIGVPWNDQMRDFAEHAKFRTIRTPSSIQVVRGINSESVGLWRQYTREMAPAIPILAPWVKAYGYES